MVVAEGLTMYLDPAAGHALFRRIVEHFPSGEVFFDAYSKLGIKLQKTNAIVRRAKATLRWGIDDPRELAAAGLTSVSVRTAESSSPRRTGTAAGVPAGRVPGGPADPGAAEYGEAAALPVRDMRPCARR